MTHDASPDETTHLTNETDLDGTSAAHGVIVGCSLCGIGIVIGSVALLFCCYSLGADFRDEGWGELASTQPGPRRIWFVLSLIGFAIAIPLFWVGFFRIVHPELSHRR